MFNNEQFKIITSNDYLFLNKQIEIVCIKKNYDIDFKFIDVEYRFEPNIVTFNKKNNTIILNENFKDEKELIVYAYDKFNKLKTSKKINILREQRNGTLVHYFRNDNYYFDNNFCFNIWCFEKGIFGIENNFEYTTDIGKASFVKMKNIIIRKKTWGNYWSNDWEEQTVQYVVDGENTYIVDGLNKSFSTLKNALKALKPRIEYAIIDNKTDINIKLSHKPLDNTTFYLYIDDEKALNTVCKIEADIKKVKIKNIPENIRADSILEIRCDKIFKPFEVHKRNFLDHFFYDNNDLGVVYFSNHISLKIWAPTAYKVEVLIYNLWNNKKNKYNFKKQLDYDENTGVHYTEIDKFKNENKFYLYRFYFKVLSGKYKHLDKITYAVDPYATSVTVNGEKGVLTDINSNKTKPKFWEKDKKPIYKNKEDAIIYEMHIRDFTINKNSGVNQKIKGTYLGAVEENTKYIDRKRNIEVKTGIDHLREIGITHIHLLPTFDFISVNETKKSGDNNRNWGYDPLHFNAIEGSYSTNVLNPIVRIKQFRTLIQGFHKNKLRVIKDVVYNHMANTENMSNIVYNYYFRTDFKGSLTNGSGCGNEVATERPMVRKFIVDSCMHWIKNYNIDGLRFDLMELIDLETIKIIVKKAKELDKDILIYGEPWKGGYSPVQLGTYKGSQKNEDFSVFNDDFRNAIRGDNSPGNGFVNGNCHDKNVAWSIIEGLKGSVYSLTENPRESINYFDAHDNYTIWDQIEKSQNNNIRQLEFRNITEKNLFDNKFVRQNLLSASILFLSQGIPFIQGGSEILRTKQGDHNSYKSADYINEFHWEDKSRFIDVFNYYKHLIAIRKNHKSFRSSNAKFIKENIDIYFCKNNESSGVIFYHIKETSKDDLWNEIVVIFNGTSIDNYDIKKSLKVNQNFVWNIELYDFNKSLKNISFNEIPSMKSYSTMIIYR